MAAPFTSSSVDVACCGLGHRVQFRSADLSAVAGTREHDLEVYPRFVNGWIGVAPGQTVLGTPGTWVVDQKPHYLRVSGDDTFRLTGIANGGTITLVTTAGVGTAALSLGVVSGTTVNVVLATTGGVITTTWALLAAFLTAQPSVAAIFSSAAVGPHVGTLLAWVGTSTGYVGDQTQKGSWTITRGADKFIATADAAGKAITVAFTGGVSQLLAVTSVVGNTINVKLGTNSSSVVTSTFDQVKTLLNGTASSAALLDVTTTGPTTGTTLMALGDGFTTAFPALGTAHSYATHIRDDTVTAIPPLLSMTLIGPVVAGGPATYGSFALSTPDAASKLIVGGWISVTELIRIARAANPSLTYVYLRVDDPSTGFQLNRVGWEWRA